MKKKYKKRLITGTKRFRRILIKSGQSIPQAIMNPFPIKQGRKQSGKKKKKNKK